MSECIVVLGCHRSGTSAVAGVLHHLGVDMGTSAIKTTVTNRKGQFEDSDFYAFHRVMVPRRGPVSFEPFRQDYTRLIREREQKPLWGLKDPRLCYIFPHFLEITKAQIKVITTQRPVEHSATSFMVAMKRAITFPESLRICQGYLESRDKAIAGFGPVLNVDFDDFGDETVRAIAGFVGLPVTEEALGFFDPSLKHL